MKSNLLIIMTLLLLVLGIIAVIITFFSNQSASVIIEWETASEIDTAGFNLYRSEEVDGTYNKINSKIIPPSNDPFSGGKYKYTDESLISGQVYYYRLEEVEMNGNRSTLGSIEVKAGYDMLMIALITGFVLIFILTSLFFTIKIIRNSKIQAE
jgi:hypothetical protein